MAVIPGNDLLIAICKALGIDEHRVSHVVIDVQIGYSVKVYIEEFGDEHLLTIDWPGQLDAAQIKREDKPHA